MAGPADHDGAARDREARTFRATLFKSLVCVEAASLLFAVGVGCYFLVGTLLGIAGSLLERIAPPPLALSALLEMTVVLATTLALASLPTAVVLGWIAFRTHQGRLGKLLLAGAGCLLLEDLLAAYPFAAFSSYFFSNVRPRTPFPFGADWHVPLAVVIAMAGGGLVVVLPLLGALFGVTVLKLERWTRFATGKGIEMPPRASH